LEAVVVQEAVALVMAVMEAAVEVPLDKETTEETHSIVLVVLLAVAVAALEQMVVMVFQQQAALVALAHLPIQLGQLLLQQE
jgi:hypothetical protein